jgi:hypothetical protein
MKKNFRLNWVDLLILVLMVGLVAGTYMKFRVSKTTNVVEPQTPITYQVQITNIRKTTVDALREGDALFDDDSGRNIGTIRSIEATPALTLAVDTEGVYHMTETDDRYDVILTVETKEGSISGNTYTVARIYTLNIGSFRDFHTKYSTWQGRIWGIER